MNTQTAFTATFTSRKTKFSGSRRKAFGMFHAIMAIVPDQSTPKGYRELIDLRMYGNPTSYNWSAAFWINSKGISGSGNATGGGHDKKAAAAEEAIWNAGIDLNRIICDTSDLPEVIRAIANALGEPTALIIESHQ